MIVFVVLFIGALILLQLVVLSGGSPHEPESTQPTSPEERPVSLPRAPEAIRIADVLPPSDAPVPLPTAHPRAVTVGVKASVEHPDRTCPFCKDSIVAKSVHVECAACSTWHHGSCFEENGGCAVFGCREQRARGVSGVRTT